MVEVYIPKPHIVTPKGIFSSYILENWKDFKEIRIKRYTLVPQGERDFNESEVRALDSILESRITNREINPKSGLGFSILSDGILNVCMWGGQYPSVLNQNLYLFDREELTKNYPDIRKGQIDQLGSFCCWELGITGHEATAFRRYLSSPQSKEDQEEYLANCFQEILS